MTNTYKNSKCCLTNHSPLGLGIGDVRNADAGSPFREYTRSTPAIESLVLKWYATDTTIAAAILVPSFDVLVEVCLAEFSDRIAPQDKSPSSWVAHESVQGSQPCTRSWRACWRKWHGRIRARMCMRISQWMLLFVLSQKDGMLLDPQRGSMHLQRLFF